MEGPSFSESDPINLGKISSLKDVAIVVKPLDYYYFKSHFRADAVL